MLSAMHNVTRGAGTYRVKVETMRRVLRARRMEAAAREKVREVNALLAVRDPTEGAHRRRLKLVVLANTAHNLALRDMHAAHEAVVLELAASLGFDLDDEESLETLLAASVALEGRVAS
jgi:hypothetical protein